ncbi:ribosomal protein S18-alanine N-acetyltransferase [Desulforamulus ferrireducens]|uniref:Ribosomal-protein-alanine N-acetyltransferase n=1 Tax=Desulforamulus ferrireducens TaxID=1833852 RepID=A0A1S6IZF8_9FIRM|nr:ribosomal protein S18-alanine N-acetyltransferase [Desulforamulus ferrireducens]AQS60158.1 ribosomal-protein-alanine N-acetyltransferase [Desulforamulus ferrireducens]
MREVGGTVDYRLTEMKLEHIPEVLAIEQVSFPTPWSQQAFTYEITQNNFAHYVVALEGEKVIGYAGMWLVLDEAHITNVAVHPNYRGKKLGLALMLEAMRQAILRGAVRMTLEVRPSNTVARELYKKLGFKEKGLRKRYYTDTNEDAIIMWVDLRSPETQS